MIRILQQLLRFLPTFRSNFYLEFSTLRSDNNVSSSIISIYRPYMRNSDTRAFNSLYRDDKYNFVFWNELKFKWSYNWFYLHTVAIY